MWRGQLKAESEMQSNLHGAFERLLPALHILGLFPNHLVMTSEWLPGRDALESPAKQSNVGFRAFLWSRETTSVLSSVYTNLTASWEGRPCNGSPAWRFEKGARAQAVLFTQFGLTPVQNRSLLWPPGKYGSPTEKEYREAKPHGFAVPWYLSVVGCWRRPFWSHFPAGRALFSA